MWHNCTAYTHQGKSTRGARLLWRRHSIYKTGKLIHTTHSAVQNARRTECASTWRRPVCTLYIYILWLWCFFLQRIVKWVNPADANYNFQTTKKKLSSAHLKCVFNILKSEGSKKRIGERNRQRCWRTLGIGTRWLVTCVCVFRWPDHVRVYVWPNAANSHGQL